MRAVQLVQPVAEAAYEGQLDALLHVLQPAVHQGGGHGCGDGGGGKAGQGSAKKWSWLMQSAPSVSLKSHDVAEACRDGSCRG